MNTGIDLPPPPPPLPPDARPLSIPDADFDTPVANSPERICPNCGAPVHGPFCYACGQSEKGMIRHLSEVLSDLADIVLNVDSRIFRSLWDLYIRPGFLTTEYLAGRRARYVTPFRLFFFLTIIAFFAMQASIGPEDLRFDSTVDIDEAQTPAEITNRVNDAVTALTVARSVPGMDAETRQELDQEIDEIRTSGEARMLAVALEGATTPEEVDKTIADAVNRLNEAGKAATTDAKSQSRLDKKLAKVRKRGETRKQELEEDAKALADGKPLPTREKKEGVVFDLNGEPWNAETNPIAIDWLPESLNKSLNDTVAHMETNIKDVRENPKRMVVAWFSMLPQTLFVVMPLFAVLLKFFYLFKRRLYMEHLLVALHSHAFIFMSLLVILLLTFLAGLAGNSPIALEMIEWLRVAAWVWLFTYLLIMQKRVYRQGWFMTVVKYCVIGLSYTIFLSLAFAVSILVTLAFT